MARPKRQFTEEETKKEIFLSRAQIEEMYKKGEISLYTLLSCLTPGLICFEVSRKTNGNTIY